MKTKNYKSAILTLLVLLWGAQEMLPQQTGNATSLKLEWNVWQHPDNRFGYYSMEQADAWANNFYDAGFLGTHALSKMLFNPEKSRMKKFLHASSGYLLGFAFSKYGSSLPIPMGEWQHEEYHRAVLATMDISSKNGMWLFHRWDGTVYGVSDEELTTAKANNLPGLLYAYVSGVQAENSSTRQNVLYDFYHPRKVYKNPLYLYNAWYVLNYFRFSASAATDSVKDIAPGKENRDPRERDFAGADLTAWLYDMFQPDKHFDSRDAFPGGNGVNRRIGFSELPKEAQQYLKEQRNLSLLNFLNPAIFGINRIKLGKAFSFNAFVQYAPAHFGNNISLIAPFRIHRTNLMIGLQRYSTYYKNFPGAEIAINEVKLGESDIYLSAAINAWKQPVNQSFFDREGKTGGMVKLKLELNVLRNIRFYVSGSYKTAGWVMGNPYLTTKYGFNTGFSFIY